MFFVSVILYNKEDKGDEETMRKRYCKFCGSETDALRCEICSRKTVVNRAYQPPREEVKKAVSSFSYQPPHRTGKKQHPYKENSVKKKTVQEIFAEAKKELSSYNGKKGAAKPKDASEHMGKQLLQLVAVGVTIVFGVLIPFLGDLQEEENDPENSYYDEMTSDILLPADEEVELPTWIEQEEDGVYLYMENPSSLYVEGGFTDEDFIDGLPVNDLIFPHSQMKWKLAEEGDFDPKQFSFWQQQVYELNMEENLLLSYELFRVENEIGEEEMMIVLKEAYPEEEVVDLLHGFLQVYIYEGEGGLRQWKLYQGDLEHFIGNIEVNLDEESFSFITEED